MADRAARAWLWSTVSLTAGAFAAAIVLAPPAGASPTRALGWLLFLGSSVHVAATGFLFTLGDVRRHALAHRTRYVWVPAGVVAVSGITAALVPPASFAWALLAYFAWQFVHFQKQNLGMAALAASAAGLRGLSQRERRILMAASVAGIAGTLAHPGLLRLDGLQSVGAAFPAMGALLAGAVCAGLLALRSRAPGDRPAGFCAVYTSSLLFFAPVFVCSSPYAAVGGMTIAHGLQYLLLVGLVADGDRCGRTRVRQVGTLASTAVIGGVGLSVASHLHDAAPLGRLLFGVFLGIAMAHFVIDAGLWRLRDPFPRRFLSERLPYLVRPRPTSVPASDPSYADI